MMYSPTTTTEPDLTGSYHQWLPVVVTTSEYHQVDTQFPAFKVAEQPATNSGFR